MTDSNNDNSDNQNSIPKQRANMGIMLLVCNCIVLGIISVIVAMPLLQDPEASEFQESIDDTPRMVFVNVGQVANQAGLTARINEKLEALKQQLSRDREKIRSKLQDQLTAEENKLKQSGNQANVEKREALLDLQKVANERLSEADRQVTVLTEQNRQTLIQAARAEIIRNAEKVARERGATTIIELDASILWHDDSQNITEQVVAEMKQ